MRSLTIPRREKTKKVISQIDLLLRKPCRADAGKSVVVMPSFTEGEQGEPEIVLLPSFVSYLRDPNGWAIELTAKVAWYNRMVGTKKPQINVVTPESPVND